MPRAGTTTMGVKIGSLRNTGQVPELSNDVYFSFVPGTSPNWRCVTKNTAGATITTTAVAYELNTWYVLQFRRVGASFQFYINHTLVATHTTNLPTAAEEANPNGPPSPVVSINALEAASKSIDIDVYRLETVDLVTRF